MHAWYVFDWKIAWNEVIVMNIRSGSMDLQDQINAAVLDAL